MFGQIGNWLASVFGVDPSDAEKRAAIRATPFPEAWRTIIERELPHFRRLDDRQRAKLLGDVQVFIAEKAIVGIEGFEIHDRAKVLVAASAALLVLGRDISTLDHVTRVMIRPDFVIVEDGRRAGGIYHPARYLRFGKVVEVTGEVELVWSQVEGAFAKLEGANTAVHELAHAFDHGDGEMDALMAHPYYDRWRQRLHQLPLSRRREGFGVITEVIADVEGPELFAVATELFFECPRRLQKLDAALFDALCEIYAIDPRTLVDR